MVEINVFISFISGFTAIFSPSGLTFLGIVFALTIVAIRTKKQIFVIISAIIIGVVFVGSHFTMIVFPMGPILGTLITLDDKSLLSFFLLGSVSIPVLITSIGFVKSKRAITQ